MGPLVLWEGPKGELGVVVSSPLRGEAFGVLGVMGHWLAGGEGAGEVGGTSGEAGGTVWLGLGHKSKA